MEGRARGVKEEISSRVERERRRVAREGAGETEEVDEVEEAEGKGRRSCDSERTTEMKTNQLSSLGRD